MVRIVAAACIAATALVVTASPAFAHICPVVTEIPVHQSSPVKVAVTVEQTPIPDVEVQLPPELHLDRPEVPPGWTANNDASSVRFHGPPIAPYTCGYFNVFVTSIQKGRYGIAVIQRDANGKVIASTVDPQHKTNPAFQQLVYVGMKPPRSGGGSSSGGPSAVMIAGVVLIAGGVVVAAIVGIRSARRRREDEREAELFDRLDEFKKQTRDRSER